MTSLKTSIKTITYLSDIGCLEIQGASLHFSQPGTGFCNKDDQESDQHKCNGKDDIESEIIQIITIVHATNGNPVKTFKQL